jgi:hypothetical protein
VSTWLQSFLYVSNLLLSILFLFMAGHNCCFKRAFFAVL